MSEAQFEIDLKEEAQAAEDKEEMDWFMREEAERDERERMWAEEAHKVMHEGIENE